MPSRHILANYRRRFVSIILKYYIYCYFENLITILDVLSSYTQIYRHLSICKRNLFFDKAESWEISRIFHSSWLCRSVHSRCCIKYLVNCVWWIFGNALAYVIGIHSLNTQFLPNWKQFWIRRVYRHGRDKEWNDRKFGNVCLQWNLHCCC